ncbi:MAG: ATP-binding protein [Methyloglobulus sp.]
MKQKTTQEIIDLIKSKKEGVHYDFKQEHHSNTIDLIHDIVCLANADYEGERYLIFGVTNAGDVCGIDKTTKTQTYFIDTLRGANFASDIYPDITLEKIEYSDKNLDVLVIKNTTQKPYYLSKEKSNGAKHIRAGTIYSRVMDANTPINSVASPIHIEKMWKEKFGLTQTTLERFKLYLESYDDWEQMGEVYFHKIFPEFTIKALEQDAAYNGNETREWARGEMGYHYSSGNLTTRQGFFYHSTLIATLLFIIFDGGKKVIVNPDWEPIGKGRVYHYLKNSLAYSYQKFISHERGTDYSTGLNFCSKSKREGKFSIPVFENKTVLSEFKNFAKKELKIESSAIEPESNKDNQNEDFYQLLDIYNQFNRIDPVSRML